MPTFLGCLLCRQVSRNRGEGKDHLNQLCTIYLITAGWASTRRHSF